MATKGKLQQGEEKREEKRNTNPHAQIAPSYGSRKSEGRANRAFNGGRSNLKVMSNNDGLKTSGTDDLKLLRF